jgi:hypothetical protein
MLDGPPHMVCKEKLHMPTFDKLNQTTLRIFSAAALLYCCTNADADSASVTRERQRTYQIDRQRCLSGQTGQNLTSCLQEAGAVLQQPSSHHDEVGASELANNALQRCEAFTGEAQQSCISRMQGHGSVEGSAATGGVLRELIEPGR